MTIGQPARLAQKFPKMHIADIETTGTKLINAAKAAKAATRVIKV